MGKSRGGAKGSAGDSFSMVQRFFDNRHEFIGSCSFHLRDSLTTRSSTIFPIVMNDDARGDPMDLNVHPEHAAWVEDVTPNCFPDSEIRRMRIIIDIIVPKAVGSQSNIVKFNYGLIATAFPEDLDAKDEKSTLTLKEILELQKESTDRQTYPLWSGIDLVGASTLSTNVPGLT